MKKQVNINDLIPLIKDSLSQGQEVIFNPFGDSMFPTLVGGKDQVTLIRPDLIRTMDICLYERKDHTYVLHRLIKIKKGEYLMMGDNQFALERGISKEDIIGVVKNITHNNKIVNCRSNTYLLKAKMRVKFRLIRRIKRKLIRAK
jgi:hypothetical protein